MNLGQVTRRIPGYEPGTGDKKDVQDMNLGQVTRGMHWTRILDM
jgi:hypothetical protein